MGCSEGKMLERISPINRNTSIREHVKKDLKQPTIEIEPTPKYNRFNISSSQILPSQSLIIKQPIQSPRKSILSKSLIYKNSSAFYPMLLVEERVKTGFYEDYSILGKIGAGSYGVVYKILHNKLGLVRALKVVKKELVTFQDDEQVFLKEIEILSQLDHPNIVKIYEFFFDGDNYYIISEFIDGGELLDQIHKIQNYCENSAAVILTQLFSAIYYLHQNNIVHRDIKPENIMLQIGKDNSLFIKLIDFGTANFSPKNKTFKTQYGTSLYLAPEILKKKYTSKCDIWSCGVILYLMLSGEPPFPGEDNLDILRNVEKGIFSFNKPAWEGISDEAKDFITQLLTYNDELRPSAEVCLKHEWITQNLIPERKGSIDISVFTKNLNYFSSQHKLQQSIIAYIIHHLSSTEKTNKLRNVFRHMDEVGDGRLRISDLKKGLESYGLGKGDSKGDFEAILSKFTRVNNDYIQYEEFLRATLDMEIVLTEKNLKMAFDYFDEEKKGGISYSNIKRVLGIDYGDNEDDKIKGEAIIRNILHTEQLSTEKDITFDEFTELMKRIKNEEIKE